MVEIKCLADDDLWRVAVLTSSGCSRFDLPDQLSGTLVVTSRGVPQLQHGAFSRRLA